MKKFKKALSILLSLCMLISVFTFTVNATEIASGTYGGNLTWTLDNEGTLTISGTGVMWNYSPSDSPWDSYKNGIKSVIIQNGVTTIGDCAFMDCHFIESISIPNSVTTIGEDAFSCCDSLTDITIPESVTSIEERAFLGCNSLTSITIPNSVTTIRENVFEHCDSLTDITVAENNTMYSSENGVLFNKDKTTLIYYPSGKSDLSYTIPNSVTTIGEDAFSWCNSLTSVTIPNSVTTIGEDAFSCCDSLTSVTIPESVTSIEERAFYDCDSLIEINVADKNAMYSSENGVLFNKDKTTLICYPAGKSDLSYTIPDSVKSIGKWAFSHCESLTSVTIPNSVTNIEEWTFFSCDSLESVIIGDSVTTIGDYAFHETAYYNDETNWENSVLYIGNCLIEAKTDITSCDIKKGTVLIADYAFIYCSSLESITIPDSVTTIGDYAFYDCDSLTSITIPESVTNIEERAFFNCTSLEAITGVKGSAAEAYAIENGFTFIALDITKLPENDFYMDEEALTMPNIAEGTKAIDIISTLAEYGITATVTDKNGDAIADNKNVGTGAIVKTSDGKEYTVIVNGDVDGTGKINSTDYLQVKNSMTGITKLQNEYFTAADTDGNGKITATDYLNIKGYLTGESDLYSK